MAVKIPKLNNHQCSVIQTEAKGEIILTVEGKYYLNGSEDIYSLVFDSFEKAKAFCEIRVKENPKIECNIYDHSAKFIERVSK